MKATFIGLGIIGAGLAVNAAMHGWDVLAWDIQPIEKSRKNIDTVLNTFTENKILSQEDADRISEGISFFSSIEEAVRDTDFVQECIVENLDIKRSTYRKIQSVNPDVVIASSTSLLMPSALREGAVNPCRIIAGHPYNPAHLMPLIELCSGSSTQDGAEDQSIALARKVYESWGKVPVVCLKEKKGFIANELNQTATRICRDQVVNGICTAEDMDKAVMFGPGLRMALLGQLLTTSLGVEGGFRNMCAKYNLPPNPDYDLLADQMDDVYNNRSEAEGRTPQAAAAYRDKMIIEILKLKNMI